MDPATALTPGSPKATARESQSRAPVTSPALTSNRRNVQATSNTDSTPGLTLSTAPVFVSSQQSSFNRGVITRSEQLKRALTEQLSNKLAAEPSLTGDTLDFRTQTDLGQIITPEDMLAAQQYHPDQNNTYNAATRSLKQDLAVVMSQPAFQKLENKPPATYFGEVLKAISQCNETHNPASPSIPLALKEKITTATEARYLLLHIHQTLGRKWSPEVLRAPKYTGSFAEIYQFLETVEAIAGPALKYEQLLYMRELHNKAPKRIKGVIAGGGPTGLLLAIKLYSAGVRIHLVEKRDTQYTRLQIIRLDPFWMKELKLYLGEEYESLFDPAIGKGTIRPDGSGHITLSYLENALHNRLSTLATLDPENIRQLACHSVSGCQAPLPGHPGYRIVARYDADCDPSLEKLPDSEHQKLIPADLLVCADGKNSQMRDQFFAHTPVTTEALYGVVTWDGPDIRNSSPDTCTDIAGTAELTSTNVTLNFHIELKDLFHPIYGTRTKQYPLNALKAMALILDPDISLYRDVFPENDNITKKRLQHCSAISDFLLEYEDDAKRMKSLLFKLARSFIESKRPSLATRTFENRQSLYIGMEIPELLQEWLQASQELMVRLEVDEEIQKEVIQTITKHWFQLIARHYKFSDTANAHIEQIPSNGYAIFPVAQEINTSDVVTVRDSAGGGQLVIMPAGDALASPHFMTASGLSGGRESTNAVEEYVLKICSETAPSEDPGHGLSDYQQYCQRIREFVLARGGLFLMPLEQDKVHQTLQDKTSRVLSHYVQQCADGNTDTTGGCLVTSEGDQFLVTAPDDKRYRLTITLDGGLEAEILIKGKQQKHSKSQSEWQALPDQYNTFEHFTLAQLGIWPERLQKTALAGKNRTTL